MKRIPIEVPEGVELPKRDKRMSFTEWLKEHEGVISSFIGQISICKLNNYAKDYAAYLNNILEEKASVIEKIPNYLDDKFEDPFDTDKINKVFYNGRNDDDGDLFTIIIYGDVSCHAQGTLNGLFIEIPE